jgi:diguanylate cyclase (GGDEF)-like protein
LDRARRLLGAMRSSLTWRIFGIAFVAIHVPLISLCFYLAFGQPSDPLPLLLTALVATVTASGATLALIMRMMQPIETVIASLAAYRQQGAVPQLNRSGSAEVGRLVEAVNLLIADVERNMGRLEREAHSDPLTGLSNRRWLSQAAELELYRAKKLGQKVSVIVFDLDHFKHINDSYGHDVGDQVLVEVAELVRRQLRPYDLLARTGGEEFCILIAGGDVGVAQAAAERIRASIAALELHSVKQARVTASFGIHWGDPGMESLRTMIKKADHQLYRAKQAGRNLVRFDEDYARRRLEQSTSEL